MESVTDYLNTFGVTVAERIKNLFVPLFDPSKEPLSPEVLAVNPGAEVNFIPVFEQGLGAPCDFLIPDKQSGVITENGIYTAPEKDGLYQVCAQIKDRPETRVTAETNRRPASGSGPAFAHRAIAAGRFPHDRAAAPPIRHSPRTGRKQGSTPL